ncbi:MAG: hypothetical protein FWG09_07160 [Synergistaceae bacterium]|nr:hypothetical protein [Synergistaceae bacterium]
MKKILLTAMICAAIFSMLFSSGAFAAEQPGGGHDPDDPFTGTWKSNWNNWFGTIILTQNGNNVTGTFDEGSGGDAGTISGTVSDKVINFTITSDTPGAEHKYRFVSEHKYGAEMLRIERWEEKGTWESGWEAVWDVKAYAERVIRKDPAALPPGVDSGSIVGMWRSERYYGNNSTVGVVFFDPDGTYRVIRYRKDRFTGEKGKFRLDGNNLEVYDLFYFERHDNSLSFNYFTEDLTKIRALINSGTRSEVEEIIDPRHPIWEHYGGITGTVGWHEIDRLKSWAETIEWIDATTIDYQNGMHNPLKLVP